ncbi:hypothetical protein [Clostridium transplantifaecale]|uniref:hypothetical protein n=1 Tax=Clostridium transplantifaecale TaxID=2479838 RepID=UPI000F6301ED|nr:hypothetical protein [Clostridium transplantifaecale]
MAYTIYARMKRVGKQKKEDLLPVAFELGKKPDTVRELLTELVRLSVRQYNERKDEGQVLSYLTKEEISGQAAAGKVSFGLRGGNDADPEKAVDNAVQCFEDGIYRVFAGEEELTGLEQAVPWGAGEEGKLVFTFIRLTMLSGW